VSWAVVSARGKQFLVGLVRSRYVSESLELLCRIATQFFGRVGQGLRHALGAPCGQSAQKLAENILDHWCKASSSYRSVRAGKPSGRAKCPGGHFHHQRMLALFSFTRHGDKYDLSRLALSPKQTMPGSDTGTVVYSIRSRRGQCGQ
jgi:hypothetical protein